MKKTLALLLALIVAISMGTVTLAECSHENATVIGSQEPDCSYEGFKLYLCSDCRTTWSEKLLPTGEHTYKTVKELAPTCVEAGYVWQECAVCGAEKNFESGEPTGEHSETYKDIFEANCSAEGYVKEICRACGEIVSEEILPKNDNHFFYNGKCMKCEAIEAVNTQATQNCDHANTYEEVFEATCSKVGSKKVICSDCEEVISEEELPMNDNHAFHNGVCLLCGAEEEKECEHSYVTVKELAPTCAEAGYVWQECEVCGAEKNFEFGEPTGEHTYKTIVDMMPTCTEPGTQHDKCEVCGAETEQDLIPATDHQNVGLDYDADDHWIYCEDCDEVLVIEGHEFAYWSANGYKHAECKHCPYATSWKTQSGELDGLPKTGDR